MSVLDFHFDPNLLETLVGGRSPLEIQRLNIQDLDAAYHFIKAYGFDLKKDADKNKVWLYHRRAVTYLQEELLLPDEKIPDTLVDPKKLKDIGFLLIYASTRGKENTFQRWACAILKVMHVLVHLDNDLFQKFSSTIQEQILRPIQAHIYEDPVSGIRLGTSQSKEVIPLKKFEIKPFKRSDSSVTKLLAKTDAVAFTLLDKLGVRFVTKTLFDVFCVLRYLVRENIVSFPHNISDQSNNTLFPINIFMEVMESLMSYSSEVSAEEVDQLLWERLEKEKDKAHYRRKENIFTSKSYRFMKFISRRLVTVPLVKEGDKKEEMSFFYPYEVQILDYPTYLQNLQGEASHEAYKKRQKQKARLRTLGPSSREQV
ncbi:MAG: TIGR04552 family protein [Bdellovibrio sp.]|nr:MAG: TIGR04552 family protein [Bdellovibrio sp.]